jgi:hypothetical protein
MFLSAMAVISSPLKVQNPAPRLKLAWWKPEEGEHAAGMSLSRIEP